MTTTLPASDHIRFAREFLDEADLEFSDRKHLKACEMLWGAVAHALIAVALRRDWPYNSHGSLKAVAGRLPNVPNMPQWLSEFNTAEQFHVNFYHGHMSTREMTRDRPKVRQLVARLLALDT